MSASLSVSVSETSYSTSKNTSTVKIVVKVTTSGSSYNTSGSAKLTVKLNGSTKASSKSVKFGKSTTTTIFSNSYTIDHNNDGTKSVSWSVKLVTDISAGTLSKSGTLKLTNIPRTSDASLSASSLYLGEALVITTNRASSSFTHTLQYSFDNSSFTNFATDVESSYAWTLPYSLASGLQASATSGILYIKCITYNGSSSVGSVIKSLTIRIPNDSNTQPSITNLTCSEGISDSPFTIFVQSFSRLKVHVAATPKYGANISSCKTVINSVTYSHTIASNVISDITSDIITISGDISVTTIVTDSRGFSVTKTTSVNILAYSVPMISALSVTQSNGQLNVKINGGISALNNQNKVTLKINYKKFNDTDFQTFIVYNQTSNYTFTNVPTSPISYSGLLEDDPCVIVVTLNDLIKSSESNATTRSETTNVSFVMGKTNAEFIAIPTDRSLYTASFMSNNGTISAGNYNVKSWQLKSGIFTSLKLQEIFYDNMLNKIVGYTSDQKIVIGDTSSNWDSFDTGEEIVKACQSFNKVILLGSENIYWIDNSYIEDNVLSTAIRSKALPIASSPWIYLFGDDLNVYIANILGEIYYLEYSNGDWEIEPVDYYLEESANTYKPLREYAPIANAHFFDSATGWIYMIYESADGWQVLQSPTHAYR